MKSMTKQSLVLFSFVLSSVAILADHHKEVEIKQTKYIPGTWKRTWINTNGKAGSMTKVIRAAKETTILWKQLMGIGNLDLKSSRLLETCLNSMELKVELLIKNNHRGTIGKKIIYLICSKWMSFSGMKYSGI